MNKRLLRSVFAAGIGVGGLSPACSHAAAVTLNFESLADLEPVTTQFAAQGVTIANADALRAGFTLNEAEFPPRSGDLVVSDSGGPMTISFATPVLEVAGYFNYGVSVTLAAFDSLGVLLGAVTSLFSANLALTGDAGSSPNELLQLAFAQGIGSVTITGDPGGGSFTLDDLTVSQPQAIPEPRSAALAGLALVLCLGSRRRRTETSRT